MENNDKVLAMYTAVHDLLMDGYDINRLKVSDITQKAGIGKGTAYEYFKSKEELIGKALQYIFLMQYQNLEIEIQSKPTMKEAIFYIFQWLEINEERRNLVMQYFRLIGESTNKVEDTNHNCMKQYMDLSLEIFQKILEKVTALGRKEQLISENIPEKFAQLQIMSNLMGFFIYAQFDHNMKEQELLSTKEFLYKSIINSLNN